MYRRRVFDAEVIVLELVQFPGEAALPRFRVV